jgi:predicted nucleic acid-binding Zn ribbon protein
MRKARDVLRNAIDNPEVMKAARGYAVLKRWPEVVGPMLAERSFPDRYERGTVWVAVQGSAWAQELRMMKGTILSRLETISGDPNLFVDVRFGVRPLPKRPEAVEAVQEKAPEREDIRSLSIREIAERRLAKWKDEGRD